MMINLELYIFTSRCKNIPKKQSVSWDDSLNTKRLVPSKMALLAIFIIVIFYSHKQFKILKYYLINFYA